MKIQGITLAEVVRSGNRIISTDTLNWRMTTKFGIATINTWVSPDEGKTWINTGCSTQY